MSIVMQLQDVAESTRTGPLSGEVRAGEILHRWGRMARVRVPYWREWPE